MNDRPAARFAQKTADLCDAHADALVLDLPLRDYGGRLAFHGQVSTVQALEDNSRVREALGEAGNGRVLVIDGSGSTRRAMLGDQLAAAAVANGWSGVIIHGVLRDSEAIGVLDLGVKALGTCPRKTEKLGRGLRDVAVRIGGIRIVPGDWLYADEDGVVVSSTPLA